jgi:hypothetical protein
MKKKDGYGMGKAGRPINAEVDWSAYLKFYDSVPREELINDISGILLQTKKAVVRKSLLNMQITAAKRILLRLLLYKS